MSQDNGDEYRPPNDNQNPFGEQKGNSQFDDPFADAGQQDIWSKLSGDQNSSNMKRRLYLYGGLFIALVIGCGGYIYSEDPTFLGLLGPGDMASPELAEEGHGSKHPTGTTTAAVDSPASPAPKAHEAELPEATPPPEHHDAAPVQQITQKAPSHAEPEAKEIMATEKHNAPTAEQEIEEPSEHPLATGKPALRYPTDGAKRYFDDTAGNPTFIWDGESPATVEFSKSPSMNPLVIKETVNGNSYELPMQWLGKGYGRVTNAQGSSPVFSFFTKPAKPVTLGLIDSKGKLLRDGALIPADGNISWMYKERDKITTFKLQVSTHKDKWEEHDLISPPSTDTSGTEVSIKGLQPGEYWVRVLAHSETSTLWETTKPLRIVVK